MNKDPRDINFANTLLYLDDYMSAKENDKSTGYGLSSSTKNLVVEYYKHYYRDGYFRDEAVNKMFTDGYFRNLGKELLMKHQGITENKYGGTFINSLNHTVHIGNHQTFVAILHQLGERRDYTLDFAQKIDWELFDRNGVFYVRGTVNGEPLELEGNSNSRGEVEFSIFFEYLCSKLYHGDIEAAANGSENPDTFKVSQIHCLDKLENGESTHGQMMSKNVNEIFDEKKSCEELEKVHLEMHEVKDSDYESSQNNQQNSQSSGGWKSSFNSESSSSDSPQSSSSSTSATQSGWSSSSGQSNSNDGSTYTSMSGSSNQYSQYNQQPNQQYSQQSNQQYNQQYNQQPNQQYSQQSNQQYNQQYNQQPDQQYSQQSNQQNNQQNNQQYNQQSNQESDEKCYEDSNQQSSNGGYSSSSSSQTQSNLQPARIDNYDEGRFESQQDYQEDRPYSQTQSEYKYEMPTQDEFYSDQTNSQNSQQNSQNSQQNSEYGQQNSQYGQQNTYFNQQDVKIQTVTGPASILKALVDNSPTYDESERVKMNAPSGSVTYVAPLDTDSYNNRPTASMAAERAVLSEGVPMFGPPHKHSASQSQVNMQGSRSRSAPVQYSSAYSQRPGATYSSSNQVSSGQRRSNDTQSYQTLQSGPSYQSDGNTQTRGQSTQYRSQNIQSTPSYQTSYQTHSSGPSSSQGVQYITSSSQGRSSGPSSSQGVQYGTSSYQTRSSSPSSSEGVQYGTSSSTQGSSNTSYRTSSQMPSQGSQSASTSSSQTSSSSQNTRNVIAKPETSSKPSSLTI